MKHLRKALITLAFLLQALHSSAVTYIDWNAGATINTSVLNKAEETPSSCILFKV